MLAIIGPPAHRHLNGVALAGRWWPNSECWLGSFVVLGWSVPPVPPLDPRMNYFHNILNKSETHPNRLPLKYKMTRVSKANESVSECSKILLCITVKFFAGVDTMKDMKAIWLQICTEI